MIKIAIVIPIFKHSGLLPEAIASALNQKVGVDYAIVLVNDGCPFEETDEVCRQYAISFPGKIFYIHKPNGGLSSARNAGIDFSLKIFPELEAIYLMDADNRISPKLLQTSYDILFSAPADVGWAYSDIDKFGIEDFCDVSGGYNIFEHVLWNFCEAGSMVKRSVFDTGVRYDESMKLGYEDWEFWLQCIEVGFKGIHAPDSGFKYRRRGESMLKDSERHHEEIMSYIKKKHNRLFGLNDFFGLEHKHAPRFAVYLSDTRQFTYLSDVTQDGAIKSYAEFSEGFLSCAIKPEIGVCPPYFIVTNSKIFSLLTSLKVLPGIFLQMQNELDAVNFCQLSLNLKQQRTMEIAIGSTDNQLSTPALLMCKTQLLQQCIKDEDGSWLISLISSHPQPILSSIELNVTANFSPPRAINTREILVSIYSELRNDYKNIYHDFYTKTYVQSLREHLSIPIAYLPKLFQFGHCLPFQRIKGGLNIGIILPVAEFGGVEKVALNYAEVLRKNGHQLHLFVIGRTSAHIPPAFENTFASITFYNDSQLAKYKPSFENNDYFGSPMPTWAEQGDITQALGMLAGMNAVINFNVSEFNSLMGNLRKLGIKTYTSQHLIDRSAFNQPQGSPHQFLAYEHAYDGVLVISRQLYSWFIANGVPSAKLIHIPNAASYPIDNLKLDRLLQERFKRKNDKLQVLYIGRFDRQKGLDRLAAVIQKTNQMGLPIEWRIVGKSILGDELGDNTANEILKPYLHPVAMSPDELNQHFSWANVMIMVSRFEGVPLTILEAGRLGCVILATSVGATEEAFDDGNTGYLFDSEQDDSILIEQMCNRLAQLVADRALLQKLERGAAEYYGQISWEKSMEPFIKELSTLIKDKD